MSLVSARVPKKKNDFKSDHEDLHFCRVPAGYFFEAAEISKDDSLCLSADNKNKINVGTLAVSRDHQISKFFLLKDFPNYPDRDFPIPGNETTPSGYLFLQTEKKEYKEMWKDYSIKKLSQKQQSRETNQINITTSYTT